MPPADLLAAGRAEVAGYGVELVEDQVVEIEAGFFVRLAGARVLRARRMLVATGVRDELPDIPGVRQRWGRDLLHCPYCHGWEVRGQPIGFGHPARLGTACLLVRQWSGDVTFFVHTYHLTAAEHVQLEARGVRVVSGEVARLVVQADRLTGVELADGRVIPRTAVFIRPGSLPHADGLLTGLGCQVNEAGFVTVNATGRTSTFGVWAAGNVVDPRAQVITCAGAGSRGGDRHQRRPGARGRRTRGGRPRRRGWRVLRRHGGPRQPDPTRQARALGTSRLLTVAAARWQGRLSHRAPQ